MQMELIALNLGIIIATSIFIMYACDTFEAGSRYLGRNFPAGIRGATINAIGSSLPELFTTVFLLFLYHDKNGFSAGIATCAGSAIFNAVVIPGLCVLSVLFFGVYVNGKLQKVDAINVDKKGFARDAFFFAVSEIVLIYFLMGTTLHWWMGGILVIIYLFYVGYLFMEYRASRKDGSAEEDDDDDDDEEDDDAPSNWFHAIRRLDFHWMLYKRGPLNTGRAWTLLIIGVILIAVPCHFLAKACIDLADVIGVEPFFTAVILAAAATSVPDTFISISDARQGDYDDAVSNAFGSNIFDINICIGLPLFVYGLMYSSVSIGSKAQTSGAAPVQELQILLLIVTAIVFLLFFFGKGIGKMKALVLFSLYGMFVTYCVGRAYKWDWLNPIAQQLQFAGF